MPQPQIDLFSRARIIEVRAADGDEADGRFEFQTESSNNSLDFYCTHMSERTLKNFAADAQAGVQFLDSHNARNLGYGRTFGGRFEIVADQTPDYETNRAGRRGNANVELAFTPPAEYMRVIIETFTTRGIRFGGGLTYASTDDFIRAVTAGIARDISVGFGQGFYRCDICGNDYRDYRACSHLAGLVYGMGDQGERQVLATVEIDGAHLFEHSAVYDGATPNAMIRKAEELTRSGEVDPERKALFEARYRIDLPEIPRNWRGSELRTAPVAANSDNGGTSMSFIDEVRAIFETTVEEAELLENLRALNDEIATLRTQAADGRSYRADLVNQAIAEGVRAHGENFDEGTYRDMLTNAPIDFIKRMTADFRAMADARLPNGRITVEDDETPAPEQRQQPATAVPDHLYAA